MAFLIRLLYTFIGITVTHSIWQGWSPWSQCSRSCGFGYQLRVRKCSLPWEESCVHNHRQFDRRTCSNPCALGSWSTWTGWSLCSSNCKRSRKRYCVDIENPRRALSPHSCSKGMSHWEEGCTQGLCHFGNWSEWMPWSCQCLHQGLLPKRIRFRRCNGRNCSGSTFDTDQCNVEEEDICLLTHQTKLTKGEYRNRLSHRKFKKTSFGRFSSKASYPFYRPEKSFTTTPQPPPKPWTFITTTPLPPLPPKIVQTTNPPPPPPPTTSTVIFQYPIKQGQTVKTYSSSSPFSFNIPNKERNVWHGKEEEGDNLRSNHSPPVLSESDEISNNWLFPNVPSTNRTITWAPNQPPHPGRAEEISLIGRTKLSPSPNRTINIADHKSGLIPSTIASKNLWKENKNFKNIASNKYYKSIRVPENSDYEEISSRESVLIAEIHWTKWGAWSGCDCLTGHQYTLRQCAYPHPAALFIHAHCPGDEVKQRPCVPRQCFVVDGGWGTWSSWSDCPQNCGSGSQWRVRVCDNPLTINGGSTCRGGARDIRLCTNRRCFGHPLDGSWSRWSAWSTCDTSCGQGVRSRTRHCTSPWPRNGGKYCDGDNVVSEKCSNATPCPEFSVGNWNNWSPWSQCTCGNRVSASWRSCTAPRPQGQGGACVGKMYRTQHCITPDYCFDNQPVIPRKRGKLITQK